MMTHTEQRLADVLGGCETSGPVAQRRIQAAEAALGLLFPSSYRSFLETYGAALCAGFEIAGLPEETVDPDETPMRRDVVKDILSYHPDSLRAILWRYLPTELTTSISSVAAVQTPSTRGRSSSGGRNTTAVNKAQVASSTSSSYCVTACSA